MDRRLNCWFLSYLDSDWPVGEKVVIHDLEQGDAHSQVPRNVFKRGRRHILKQGTEGIMNGEEIYRDMVYVQECLSDHVWYRQDYRGILDTF